MATGWDGRPMVVARRDRRLVCLELQAAAAAGWARSAGLAAMLSNCRALLAFARGAGWPVVHIHRRRPGGARAMILDRPLAGLEPLPSEAVFFREPESSAARHPLATAPWSGERCESVVIGFVTDQDSADAFALAPGGAIPVGDALAGGYARQAADRAGRVAEVGRLIAPTAACALPPGWPHAANAP